MVVNSMEINGKCCIAFIDYFLFKWVSCCNFFHLIDIKILKNYNIYWARRVLILDKNFPDNFILKYPLFIHKMLNFILNIPINLFVSVSIQIYFHISLKTAWKYDVKY